LPKVDQQLAPIDQSPFGTDEFDDQELSEYLMLLLTMKRKGNVAFLRPLVQRGSSDYTRSSGGFDGEGTVQGMHVPLG
jgi:hypothetical protein